MDTAAEAIDVLSAVSARRHLVPCDETPASEHVIDWVLENLYRPGDIIHLFRVIPPPRVTVLSDDTLVQLVEEDPELSRQAETKARQYIAEHMELKLVGKQVNYEVELVRHATDPDSVGGIICKRAEQLNVSTVIMARHSKAAIVEFFVGSATIYTVHHCKAPLLVLHVD